MIQLKFKYLNKFIFTFAVVAMSSLAVGQELSCDTLQLVAEGSTEVRDALIELGTVEEGSEVDDQLGELINDLIEIADYEGDGTLEEEVDDRAAGWEELDGDLLMSGLNGAIVSLDTLLERDCY